MSTHGEAESGRRERKRCQNHVPTWRPEDRCSRPAVVQLRFGCVHEHIYKSLACGPCADRAVSGTPVSCYRCTSEGTEPHACKCLAVVLVDLREAS